MSDESTTGGRYLGQLILQPLPDGRLMRVVEPFGFLDKRDKRWPVPVGAKVDGASIPQALWSFIGGPFEGNYRDASVVHDYYCDVRTEPWRAVHRVFYEAMCVSGVSESRAKLMYAAVYFSGPRWSDTTVENANLPRTDDPTILYYVEQTKFQRGVLDAVYVEGESALAFLDSGKFMWPEGTATRLDLNHMEDLIKGSNPSLVEIDEAINEAVQVLESPWRKNERKLVATNG